MLTDIKKGVGWYFFSKLGGWVYGVSKIKQVGQGTFADYERKKRKYQVSIMKNMEEVNQ